MKGRETNWTGEGNRATFSFICDVLLILYKKIYLKQKC